MRRSGPVHHDELLERVLAPGAVLVDYLAEEVLADLTDGERQLLALAAHLPYLSDELLVDLGHDDLVGRAEALVEVGLFLEPRARPPGDGQPPRRRVPPPRLPRPDDDELRRAVEAFEARGDVEAALVLARRRSATRGSRPRSSTASSDRTGSWRPSREPSTSPSEPA